VLIIIEFVFVLDDDDDDDEEEEEVVSDKPTLW
jgi:hypothetical protein